MRGLIGYALTAVTVLGLTLTACGPGVIVTPAPPAGQAGAKTGPTAGPTAKPGPTTAATPANQGPTRPFSPRVEAVAERLETPWALAFAPDGRLFFTERPGRIRVIAGGQLQGEPVATIPVASTGEAGLMGLALDPQFAQNHFLYIMYTYRNSQGVMRNRVARLTEADNRASEEKVIFDDVPGASIHDGGRIKFGPDGKLYVTTGDASLAAQSQNRDSVAGKIHRMNPDGSAPSDNPFPGSTVFSFGHRNPQGLAWHPSTRTLFITEHGPVGNDEVNIIAEPGRNYGWPEVFGEAGDPRFVNPILAFSPSIAPSGATFYDGQQLPDWRGNLFFTTLTGRHLHRVILKGPDFRSVEKHERLFDGEYGRLRDIVQGPDGFLYFTTSNRDGRGSPARDDDRVLRIQAGP